MLSRFHPPKQRGDKQPRARLLAHFCHYLLGMQSRKWDSRGKGVPFLIFVGLPFRKRTALCLPPAGAPAPVRPHPRQPWVLMFGQIDRRQMTPIFMGIAEISESKLISLHVFGSLVMIFFVNSLFKGFTCFSEIIGFFWMSCKRSLYIWEQSKHLSIMYVSSLSFLLSF